MPLLLAQVHANGPTILACVRKMAVGELS